MRYDLHDTNDKARDVVINVGITDLRNYLGEFKTHCRLQGSQYEFNHFVNWLRKEKNIEVEQFRADQIIRVDM